MENYASRLRKQKKDQVLLSKRNNNPPDCNISAEELCRKIKELNPMLMDRAVAFEIKMSMLLKELDTTNPERLKLMMLFVRKLLSQKFSSPIDLAISLGYTVKLAQFIFSPNTEIQLNCLWSLTNMAAKSSEAVKQIRALGLQYKVVDLMDEKNDYVKEQSMWLIGNITGDSMEARDEMLSTSLMEKLIEITSPKSIKLNILKVACWIISNIYKYKPCPLVHVKELLSNLNNILYVNDDEVLSDVLWTLDYLSDSGIDTIKTIRKFIDLTKLVSMLTHTNELILKPTLIALGNICLGDSEDVDAVIKSGCLPEVRKIIASPTQVEFALEGAWFISNIAADPINHIDQLIESECIDALIFVMKNKINIQARKEALVALYNSIMSSTFEQIAIITNKGSIEALNVLLDLRDPALLTLTINTIENILEAGSQANLVNEYAAKLDSVGGKSKLEALTTYSNEDVSKNAEKILTKYYDQEILTVLENNKMEVDEKGYNE